jgi:hypothetical protein
MGKVEDNAGNIKELMNGDTITGEDCEVKFKKIDIQRFIIEEKCGKSLITFKLEKGIRWGLSLGDVVFFNSRIGFVVEECLINVWKEELPTYFSNFHLNVPTSTHLADAAYSKKLPYLGINYFKANKFCPLKPFSTSKKFSSVILNGNTCAKKDLIIPIGKTLIKNMFDVKTSTKFGKDFGEIGYDREADLFYYEAHTDEGSYLAIKKKNQIYPGEKDENKQLICNPVDERMVHINSGYKIQIGTQIYEFK